MKPTKLIAYYRVSTERQGRSGLGLEAQRTIVEQYAANEGGVVLAEFTDIQSGRSNARPNLMQALAQCRMRGATLVVAKLDRLARNAHFLAEIVDGGVDVVFCNLPQLPPGSVGRFMVQIMASIAELESGMISDRTKAALAAARARGSKLGGDRGDNRPAGLTQMGHAAKQERANKRAEEVMQHLMAYQAQGALTKSEMARMLNQDGVQSAKGGVWTPTQVGRVIERCHAIEAAKVQEAKKRASELVVAVRHGAKRPMPRKQHLTGAAA